MSEYSDYYIAFTEADKRYWYMKWLKSGFSHCFVLKADRGVWLKYDAGHGELTVDVVKDWDKLFKECIIVKINSKPRKKWVYFNTCVSMVKLITGLGGLALTPYQLFKRIT